MKKLTVALSAVAVTVMMAGMADAAEVYNKDGNKLDLYGKVDGLHYFSKVVCTIFPKIKAMMAISPMFALVLKAKPRLMTN